MKSFHVISLAVGMRRMAYIVWDYLSDPTVP